MKFILTLTTMIGLSVCHADFTGSALFNGATVDLTASGNINGSDQVNVTSGGVDLLLLGTPGAYTGLTLTGGMFDIADTTIGLGVTGLTGGSAGLSGEAVSELTISGFGFSVGMSELTLSPTASPGEYEISGLLNILADQGTVTAGFDSFDMGANPVAVSPSLLIDSTISISDPTPGDGLVSITGALKFDGEEIINEPGVILTVSSVNTLNFGGSLSAIPEPSSFSLILFGCLGLSRMMRNRRS